MERVMKSLQIPEIPDAVYDVIERRARQTGRSPAEEAAHMLARVADDELREAELMEEIRQGLAEQASKGVYITGEEMQAAIDRGRE
jgi:hypothetical protein